MMEHTKAVHKDEKKSQTKIRAKYTAAGQAREVAYNFHRDIHTENKMHFLRIRNEVFLDDALGSCILFRISKPTKRKI